MIFHISIRAFNISMFLLLIILISAVKSIIVFNWLIDWFRANLNYILIYTALHLTTKLPSLHRLQLGPFDLQMFEVAKQFSEAFLSNKEHPWRFAWHCVMQRAGFVLINSIISDRAYLFLSSYLLHNVPMITNIRSQQRYLRLLSTY